MTCRNACDLLEPYLCFLPARVRAPRAPPRKPKGSSAVVPRAFLDRLLEVRYSLGEARHYKPKFAQHQCALIAEGPRSRRSTPVVPVWPGARTEPAGFGQRSECRAWLHGAFPPGAPS